MGFVYLDDMPKETVTPRHSTAFGELVTGEHVELGRLRFKTGEGAKPHAHAQEQVLIVIEGLVRMTLDGQEADLGPGSGYLAPPNVLHGLEALEDSMVISCKNVISGVGHKI